MKHIKYFLVLLIITLSFYFTEKIMIHMENKNPIMIEINKKENEYRTKAVNAIIENNTIIPGIRGKRINKRKSFAKMNEFGFFNDTFLVYDELKPEISLEDNLDKIIVKGNPKKRMVSLVIISNDKIEKFLNKNNTKYAKVASLNTKIIKKEKYILGEKDYRNISDLNAVLNKNKSNSKICMINYSNIEFCREKKYYLIDPLIKTNETINNILAQISSGSMILINKNLSFDNFMLILNEIKKQDLNLVPLDELLNEKNS